MINTQEIDEYTDTPIEQINKRDFEEIISSRCINCGKKLKNWDTIDYLSYNRGVKWWHRRIKRKGKYSIPCWKK